MQKNPYFSNDIKTKPEIFPKMSHNVSLHCPQYLKVFKPNDSIHKELASYVTCIPENQMTADTHEKADDIYPPSMSSYEDAIGSIKNKLATIEEKLTKVSILEQSLATRQYVSDIENRVMLYIFPACRSSPYYLRSLQNLLTFLSNPSNKEIAGDNAEVAWNALTQNEQTSILRRKEWILSNTNSLKIHIKFLKKKGDPFAHPKYDFNELIRYYESVNEQEIVESLRACQATSEMEFPSL